MWHLGGRGFIHIFPLMGINVLNAPTVTILFCAENFVVKMVKNITFFVCVVSLIIVGPKSITPNFTKTSF